MDEELVPLPSSGRIYEESIRVGPAGVTPANRARLDAVAGWLQDVACNDVVDGGLADAGFWIVRRTRIRVERLPQFTEKLRLRTFCSGASRALAERRTIIDGDAGAAIEAVSVWVNVDPESQLPARLPESFMAVYALVEPRKPRSRLRHPPPPADARAEPWTFRSDDLDVVGHVNNARYWAIADEVLNVETAELPLDVEMEHRAAAPAGEAVIRSVEDALWITSPDGEVHASAAVLPAQPG